MHPCYWQAEFSFPKGRGALSAAARAAGSPFSSQCPQPTLSPNPRPASASTYGSSTGDPWPRQPRPAGQYHAVQCKPTGPARAAYLPRRQSPAPPARRTSAQPTCCPGALPGPSGNGKCQDATEAAARQRARAARMRQAAPRVSGKCSELTQAAPQRAGGHERADFRFPWWVV